MAPLRLAVFDLDYTIWQPEMYQIYGPPKLIEQRSTHRNGSDTCVESGKMVVDQSGTPITVFDGA